jgi:Fe-S-cluster containining protein
MTTPCEVCQGACCEVIPVPLNPLELTQDRIRHLRMRGLVIGTEVLLNCRCSNLTGLGTCGIYEDRPQVCREFAVGSPDCRKAVTLLRPMYQAKKILALIDEKP